MHGLSVAFLHESEKMLSGDDLPLQETSLLTLHWGYVAAAHFMRLSQIEPGRELRSAMETVHRALKAANTRWRAAGKCSTLLSHDSYLDHQLTIYGIPQVPILKS